MDCEPVCLFTDSWKYCKTVFSLLTIICCCPFAHRIQSDALTWPLTSASALATLPDLLCPNHTQHPLISCALPGNILGTGLVLDRRLAHSSTPPCLTLTNVRGYHLFKDIFLGLLHVVPHRSLTVCIFPYMHHSCNKMAQWLVFSIPSVMHVSCMKGNVIQGAPLVPHERVVSFPQIFVQWMSECHTQYCYQNVEYSQCLIHYLSNEWINLLSIQKEKRGLH